MLTRPSTSHRLYTLPQGKRDHQERSTQFLLASSSNSDSFLSFKTKTLIFCRKNFSLLLITQLICFPNLLMAMDLMKEDWASASSSSSSSNSSGSSSPSFALGPIGGATSAAAAANEGVLELGVETKVKLFMLASGQAGSDKYLESPIPNPQTMIDLIDQMVARDITQLGQTIIQSGYLTPKIVTTIQDILKSAFLPVPQQYESAGTAAGSAVERPSSEKSGVEVDNQKLKVAVEIITNLVNRAEFGGLNLVFRQLGNIVQFTQDSQVKKLGLQKLAQIINDTVPISSLKECLQKVVPLLIETDYKVEVAHLLSKALPNLVKEDFSFFNPLLADKDRRVRIAAAEILGEVVKTAPSFAAQAFSFLRPLFDEKDEDVNDAAAEGVGEVVTADPSFAAQACLLLKPLLTGGGGNIRHPAAKSLGKVLAAVPAEQVPSFAQPLIGDVDEHTKVAVAYSFRTVDHPSPSFIAQAFSLLKPLISSEDYGYIEQQVQITLSVLLNAAPAEQVPSLLQPFFTDEKFKDWVNSILGTAASTSPPSHVAQFCSLLTPFLANDEDLDLRLTTIISLGGLAGVVPVIAAQAFSLLKPLLTDKDKDIREFTLRTLEEIAKKLLPEQAFSLSKSLLADKRQVVRQRVKGILQNIAKDLPSTQVCSLLQLLFADENDIVRSAAAWILQNIAKDLPPEQAFSLTKRFLADEKTLVRVAAAESLSEIVKDFPAAQAYPLLQTLLADEDNVVRINAFGFLNEVVKKAPSFATQACSLIKPHLVDKHDIVRSAAASNLGKIVKAVPVAQAVLLLQPFLTNRNDLVKSVANKILDEVYTAAPAA